MIDQANVRKDQQKTNSNTKKIIKPIIRVIVSVIGFFLSVILLFFNIRVTLTDISDTSILNNCGQTTSSKFLSQIESLQILIIVLNGIGIGLFGSILMISIHELWSYHKFGNNIWESSAISFSFRIIVTYFLLLDIGCLFGNCIKMVISLNEVQSCASDKQIIVSFQHSSQTLAVLSGICQVLGLVYLAVNPLIFRIQSKQKKENIKKYIQFEPLQQKSTHSINNLLYDKKLQSNSHHQIQTSNKFIPKQVESIIPVSSQRDKKKPRIFGKQFLTQQLYGLSSKSKGTRVYEIRNEYGQSKQKFVKPPFFIELDLGFGSQQSKDDKLVQNRNNTHTGLFHKSQQILSNVINISNQGPLLQMGEYFNEPQRQKDKNQASYRKIEKDNRDNKDIQINEQSKIKKQKILEPLRSHSKKRIFS